MNHSILDIIDRADDEGVYTFVVRKYSVHFEPKASGMSIVRNLLRSHFCTFTTCILKSGSAARWTEGLDATASVCERGSWTVRLNLAKFFRLPACNPRSELAELRAFLEAMKPFFEDRVNSMTVVDLLRKSRVGDVSSEIECRYPLAKGLPSVVDKTHTKRLRGLVEGSVTLQTFLKNLSLSGHTVGPWDFSKILETMLFGLENGPAMRQFMDEQRAPQGFWDRLEREQDHVPSMA